MEHVYRDLTHLIVEHHVPLKYEKIEKEFRHSILLCCVTQHGQMMAMDGTSCMKHDLQKLDGLMAFTM